MTDMPDFVEEYLQFSFYGQWTVLKYDYENFYKEKVLRLVPTKAVDFIGILSPKNCLFLIEVKDYRKKHPSATVDELANIIGAKCRDTIAGIMGAIHVTGDAKWDVFADRAVDKSIQIRIVFLYERRDGASKVHLTILTEAIKKKLDWLSQRVFVTSLDQIEDVVPGLKVKNLTGAGQI